jgi:hypothetical protein
MASGRLTALRRVATHLTGWRATLLLVSLIPLIAAIFWIVDDWVRALVLTLAAIIPIVAIVFVSTADSSRTTQTLDQLLGPTRRTTGDIPSLERRVDVMDLVMSSEMRRAWEPTTLPFVHVGQTEKPVLLLPGADYHLPEIVGIADELDARGVPNVIAVGVPHWERTGDGLIWYDREVFAAPDADEIAGRFSAVVTMKDWAGYGPLVEAAKEDGIPTFAKVEGAQDFHDVDTNTPRRPYRTADHILCQGQNDFDALEGMQRTIVGSTRLERLWWAPPSKPSKPLAVINLNFTYGVLTEARDLWLSTAIEGCERAGIPYVISVHPAERARIPHPRATAISASRLLRHATVLISRFSTLPYEAMARGVPFVYHNPHEEEVPTFKEPLGAFAISTDAPGLRTILADTGPPSRVVREHSARFFGRQIDVGVEMSSETRSVQLLVELGHVISMDPRT